MCTSFFGKAQHVTQQMYQLFWKIPPSRPYFDVDLCGDYWAGGKIYLIKPIFKADVTRVNAIGPR